MSNPDEGFIRHRSRNAVSFTIARLLRGGLVPWATKPRRLDYANTIVVGAGPSATAAIGSPWWRSMRDLGARVIVVNASARLVPEDQIAAVVIRESVPMADQVPNCPLAVLDLQTHPDTEIAARERCDDVAFFAPSEMRHLGLCAALAAPPLASGTAALTAAVELALTWGACSVFLVGVDLAYAPEGDTLRAYASGAPRDGVTMTREGRTLVMEGNEADDARHDAAGVRRHGRRYGAIEVPGSRGEPVTTSAVWLDQIEHLGRVRRRWPGAGLFRVGDGALLDGWAQYDLAKCCMELPFATVRPTFDFVDMDPARALVAAECEALAELCSAMLADRIDIADLATLAAMIDGAPRVQPLADAELLDAGGVPEGLERGRYLYEALARCAEAVRSA